jgi:hypothetical protein
VVESITSMVRLLDGSTHSPPMKKESLCWSGASVISIVLMPFGLLSVSPEVRVTRY